MRSYDWFTSELPITATFQSAMLQDSVIMVPQICFANFAYRAAIRLNTFSLSDELLTAIKRPRRTTLTCIRYLQRRNLFYPSYYYIARHYCGQIACLIRHGISQPTLISSLQALNQVVFPPGKQHFAQCRRERIVQQECQSLKSLSSHCSGVIVRFSGHIW